MRGSAKGNGRSLDWARPATPLQLTGFPRGSRGDCRTYIIPPARRLLPGGLRHRSKTTGVSPMASRKRAVAIGAIVIVLVVAVVIFTRPGQLVLTGIVTTNDVIVSPQVSAQLTRLLVKEGDKVDANQLLAVLAPDELRADRAFAAQSEQGLGDQVQVSEAALRYQEKQTADQIKQADANVATAIAQQQEAAANLGIAKLSLSRSEAMLQAGAISNQDLDQGRTNSSVASGRARGRDGEAGRIRPRGTRARALRG